MSYSSTDSQGLRSDTESTIIHQDSIRARWSSSPLSSVPSGAQSPLRHHRRALSNGPREVIETLNAISLSDYDVNGVQIRRVNQYIIKKEIGSGSFGSVYEAEDQTGKKFAIKEFSKNQLRKRARSNILRRAKGPGRRGPGRQHQRSVSDIHDDEEGGNALNLIKEEIAIMKKLDHENVVHLFEVLDVPDEDSLYMVVEMCSKGVVMKVGYDTQAEPYPEEQCRVWFRDLILGIEYLHAQGIIHRDIKPDNLLLTDDDCLKIGDFGVSEMFKSDAKMETSKSSGSPAFLPPELCQAGHGSISGTAADIWSMGITLYCLLFGRLPYSNYNLFELYKEICDSDVKLPEDLNPSLRDLLTRLLERDPKKRIRMDELREHPWVTNNGEDCLLPVEENTAQVAAPTQEEIESSITLSLQRVLTVVKAYNKFRRLSTNKRTFEGKTHLSADHGTGHHRSRSLDVDVKDLAMRNRSATFDTGGFKLPSTTYLSASNLSASPTSESFMDSPTGPPSELSGSASLNGYKKDVITTRLDSVIQVDDNDALTLTPPGAALNVGAGKCATLPKEIVVPINGPSIEVELVESPSEDFSFDSQLL